MPYNPYASHIRKTSEYLRDETRKIRKAFLIWCLLALTITKANLLPNKISALGLEINSINEKSLLRIIFIILLYHLFSFVIYAMADFLQFYINYKSTEWHDDVENFNNNKNESLSKSKLNDEDRIILEEEERRLGASWRAEEVNIYSKVEKLTPYIIIFRATLDFALPILIAIYCFYSLFIYKL